MAGPGSSVAIVGAGQIGRAVCAAFVDRGWEATVYARTAPAWPLLKWKLKKGLFDRELKWGPAGARFKHREVESAARLEADCVVDTIAFDAEDIKRYDPEKIGRLIVVSSASVYCDGQGRTLDEARKNGFPEFPAPISELQTTVAPGFKTYSARKIRMEQKAVEMFGDRVTILRPCAIYGEWSRHPREWWFIKRMLDSRASIPIAHDGSSRFQTTDVQDIAYFSVDAAEQDRSGIYNIADAGCPTILDIAELARDVMESDTEFVLLDQQGHIGRTPWSVPRPFMISNRKATEAGYGLPSSYCLGALPAMDWLKNNPPADWRAAFPQLAAYPWDLFDYEAEDRFLHRA